MAIDVLDDMEALFEGIDLEEISVSMTINPSAWILLAMYVALAESEDTTQQALWHHSERYPEGVRGPEGVGLSDPPEHAYRARHHRVLRAQHASL